MVERMKKIQVRSRDIERELTQYAISITKKDHVELLEDAFRVLLINHEPAFFEYHDTWVPALKYLQTHPCLRKVTVDMGAIRFIIGGADIMRPGVVAIDEGIAKDDFVVVVDQTHCNEREKGENLGERVWRNERRSSHGAPIGGSRDRPAEHGSFCAPQSEEGHTLGDHETGKRYGET